MAYLMRAGIWYYQGLKSYLRDGFERASKQWDPQELAADLTDRVYVVTGANSGIGKAASAAFAQRNGTVHMVCRDKARGEAAVAEIIEQTGNKRVHLHLVDLSSLAEISAFCRSFELSGSSLHCLVANAGVMVHERKQTMEGNDLNCATNLFGPHVMTRLLLPLLQRSSVDAVSGAPLPVSSSVVLVSSGGMLTEKLNASDLQCSVMQPYDGARVYSQNKRAQVYLAQMLASQSTGEFPGVRFYSMHPGWADTPAVQISLPGFYARHKDRLRTPEQGADTAVWLAIKTPVPNGGFFFDRAVAAQHLPLSWTESSAADLQLMWQQLETIIAPYTSTSTPAAAPAVTVAAAPAAAPAVTAAAAVPAAAATAVTVAAAPAAASPAAEDSTASSSST